MATPPFNIAETTPQDTDVVLTFPTAERLYRDVVESWLNILSDPTTGLLKAGAFPTALVISSTAMTIGSLLGAGRPMTQQTFVAGGTWTKPAGCIRAIFEATGAGGGSGATDGQGATTAGATGGGGAGFYGFTPILDVSLVASAVVTIGAAGTAGATPSGNGGNGGDTAITISGVTYTWGGGKGSTGLIANGNAAGSKEGGAGGSSANLLGGSAPGGISIYSGPATGQATGGNGGSNPFGTGGVGDHIITTGGLVSTNGVGHGGGGSGSGVNQSTGDSAGALGSNGAMRVYEFY